MEKTTSKIFKKGSLDFKDSVKIDDLQVKKINEQTTKQSGEISTDVKAVIVENQKDYSVIEVTCTCGKKLYLRCNYPQTTEKTITQK